jgi:hypothetical protein
MTKTDFVRDATLRFARDLRTGGAPDLIRAQLRGAEGIDCLCAVEAVIAGLWPTPPAKELIWLTQTAAPDALELQAFAAGELLGAATYDLVAADV